MCIHPWQFWEPHPLRIKRYISLVVQRRRLGGVLARSLVVGCPRHHRFCSMAFMLTSMSSKRRTLLWSLGLPIS